MAENKKQSDMQEMEAPERWSRGVVARVRRYLLTGIVVTAPITITIYLTYVFLTFIDDSVSKMFPDMWHNGYYYSGATVPGLGLLAALAFFIIVGWFATNFLGRLVIGAGEYIVDKMPVIRTIYGSIKQIFETIMASQSQAFREVVMLEYPRRGVWSIGFVTGRSEGEVQRITAEETVNVFVPTTPNPTSGYLLFVPRTELTFLNMSVEEGVKLVVSAGIISPPDDRLKGDAARTNKVKAGMVAPTNPVKEALSPTEKAIKAKKPSKALAPKSTKPKKTTPKKKKTNE